MNAGIVSRLTTRPVSLPEVCHATKQAHDLPPKRETDSSMEIDLPFDSEDEM